MNQPKRKYTVTEKALAANRRNLILARAVDPKFRCRVTRKKLDACRANLTKALAALRAASLTPDGYRLGSAGVPPASGDQRTAGGDVIRIGEEAGGPQAERGPRPALPEKGALPADSPAYGTSFTRGLYAVSLRRSARLAGETSAGFDAHVGLFLQALGPRSGGERRLARGIAETVWRRLRLYRGQARWERASLIYRLHEAARGPTAQAWEDDLLTPVSLARDLGWEIERIFSTDGDLPQAAEKLNARLERLSRLWVVGRGGDPILFEDRAPGRVRDGLLAALSPASMGNPFLRPSEVAALMKRGEACELRRFPSSRVGGPASLFIPRGPFWADFDNASTRFGLMFEFCRRAPGERAGVGIGRAGIGSWAWGVGGSGRGKGRERQRQRNARRVRRTPRPCLGRYSWIQSYASKRRSFGFFDNRKWRL